MKRDCYAVLGVTPQSSVEEIKAAFRKLSHIYHPDKPGGNEEIYKEIIGAYQILSDPSRRRQYDAERQTTHKEPPKAAPNTSKSATETTEDKTSMYVTLSVIAGIILITWITAALESSPSEPPSPEQSQEAYLPPLPEETVVPTATDTSEQIVIGALGQASERYALTFDAPYFENLGSTLAGRFGYGTYSPRTSTGYFISASFDGTNTGLSSFYMYAQSFVLEDQVGRIFYPEQVYHCSNPNNGYGQTEGQKLSATFNPVTLKPGIPCTWTLLFEVSNLSEQFRLRFRVE